MFTRSHRTGWYKLRLVAAKGSTFGGKSDGLDGTEGPGQFVPFANTAVSRATNDDSRQSLDERYPTWSDFVAQRTDAAAALRARRLL